jgi:DNA-binding MarR family transcriptional regulator
MAVAVDGSLAALERSLFRVAKAVTGLRVGAVGDDLRVDRAGLAVLAGLEHAGEPRLSELASRLALDPSTVSRQVRALEDAGLVDRRSDPFDGRASRFAVTPRGSAALEDVRAQRRALLKRALGGWSAGDRDTLSALLGRLAEDLGPDPCPSTTSDKENS